MSVALDSLVNGVEKAVECCNHLTHTHLSCPFVSPYRYTQKEPFVESAELTERQSVTQTAVGTDLLALFCFLCWHQCVFCVCVWVCGLAQRLV